MKEYDEISRHRLQSDRPNLDCLAIELVLVTLGTRASGLLRLLKTWCTRLLERMVRCSSKGFVIKSGTSFRMTSLQIRMDPQSKLAISSSESNESWFRQNHIVVFACPFPKLNYFLLLFPLGNIGRGRGGGTGGGTGGSLTARWREGR